ncbi:MAG: hypothetical protein IKU83_05695 [Lachnospiraceae bacterium]|nr:hypothetical protein [Lachnospiraceae bacterium]
MIDIHAHILPGADDGALEMSDTLEMVRLAAESGVSKMIATPHCNIPGLFENYFCEAYVERFRRMEQAIKEAKIPVEVYPGMEVFATEDLPQLLRDGKVMTLNQSHYLLMEFSFDEDPDFAWDIVRQVRTLDVIPVIAHVERYEFVQRDPQIVYDWRREGNVIQINKGSVMGRFGRRARRTAYRLLDHNLVSVIASDAHGPLQRTPYMLDAFEELLLDYPERYLKILFEENPKRVLEDQPIVNFECIPFERGYDWE